MEEGGGSYSCIYRRIIHSKEYVSFDTLKKDVGSLGFEKRKF